MIPDEALPLLHPAQSPVLLIFFRPLEGDNRQERALLTALADSLQKQLGEQLRILKIDQASHPDVVHSFAITQTPAFVLVRRGIELWRQEGLSDEATLVALIQNRLAQKTD